MQNFIIESIFKLVIEGRGSFDELSPNEIQIIELLKILQEDFK